MQNMLEASQVSNKRWNGLTNYIDTIKCYIAAFEKKEVELYELDLKDMLYSH